MHCPLYCATCNFEFISVDLVSPGQHLKRGKAIHRQWKDLESATDGVGTLENKNLVAGKPPGF